MKLDLARLVGALVMACLAAPAVLRAADSAPAATAAAAASAPRFFELRTYHASDGKLDALNTRFREHTNALFLKHGMTIIGFWTPAEGETAKNTLIYILAYPSKEVREQAWKDFQNDPDWKKAKAESEADGIPLAKKVDSVYLNPTDYSPIK